MNIYQLSVDQIRINELLEENGGELTPEIEEALIINKENFVEKCENYAAAIKTLENDVEACKKEIDRVNGLKKAKEKAIERMKETLKGAFNTFGVEKQTAGLFTISIRKSESVEIIDEKLVPDQFKTVETIEKISKKELKEYLETVGSETEYARINQNQNINIR